ncbi:MAG: hypothetical protein KC550_00720 [Nanoarchaeota archaeon]|nr:hypothetical protein [Nanoarchaeota archaeon]
MVNNEEIEDINEIDLIYENSDRIDALVELLIAKGVISEEEYNSKLEEVIERNYEPEDNFE